ncbi:MAG TPA: carboxypeptidase-like regulatory domain-containing protein [Planctomycetota bacterium]|nr:carboxypeptidase-like regulatory domain-containing protein [Planctomycetota bacterium]
MLGALVARWTAGGRRAQGVAPAAPDAPAQAAPRGEPSALASSAAAESVHALVEQQPQRTALEAPTSEAAISTAAGLELAGRVVDDLGRPIERFEVALGGPGAETSSEWPRADAPLPAGEFVLHGLGPGEWTLVASVPNAPRRSAPSVVDLPGFVGTLELVVPRTGALAGDVLDVDGVPIAEAAIEGRYRIESGHLRELGRELRALGYDFDAVPLARSDRSGAFTIEDQPPGVHELRAVHPDFCAGLWLAVEVAPGEVNGDVELRLTRGGRILGVVETAPGGVGDLKIGLYPMRGEVGWSDTSTDADGRFAFEHVFPGEYIVDHTPHAAGSTQLRRRIEVREGETTEVVFGRPERPVQLVGRAVRGGVPVGELRVVAHRLDGDDRGEEATSAADGSFAMELGGAGRYELIASLAHTSYAYFEVDVPDAPTHEVTLDLPGGRVTGRILDAQGEPLLGIPVTLLGGGEIVPDFDYREQLRRGRTGKDGSFAFELLAEGTYTLRAPDGFQRMARYSIPDLGRALSAPLALGAFGSLHVELHLPAAGRVVGVLVDALDTPVDRARVGARDAAGRALSAFPWEVESDGTGAFELGFLAPGVYTLLVRSGERTVEFPAIEVEAGRATSARLVLP